MSFGKPKVPPKKKRRKMFKKIRRCSHIRCRRTCPEVRRARFRPPDVPAYTLSRATGPPGTCLLRCRHRCGNRRRENTGTGRPPPRRRNGRARSRATRFFDPVAGQITEPEVVHRLDTASVDGALQPLYRFGGIAPDAGLVAVTEPQTEPGFGISVIRSPPEPPDRFGLVPFDADSLGMAEAPVILRGRVFLFRRPAQIREGLLRGKADIRTSGIEERQSVLSFPAVLFRGFPVPAGGLAVIPFRSESRLIAVAQVDHRVNVSLFGGAPEPLVGFFRGRIDEESDLVNKREKPLGVDIPPRAVSRIYARTASTASS